MQNNLCWIKKQKVKSQTVWQNRQSGLGTTKSRGPCLRNLNRLLLLGRGGSHREREQEIFQRNIFVPVSSLYTKIKNWHFKHGDGMGVESLQKATRWQEWFVVAYNNSFQSITLGNSPWQELWDSWSHHTHSQERTRENKCTYVPACLWSA
jgi:hypothetical protein